MSKLFILLSLLGTLNHTSYAQSIADLLIQLELDEQKLSSMKNTLQEMYQGYTELKQGYTRIRDIAKDNFNLHAVFLDALLAISPAVRGDPRITTIINSEYSIVSGYRTANARWTAAGVFNGQELEYIISTYSALLQRCLQSVEELTMVLTADQLRMSDAERMQAIGRINADTQAQLTMMQQLDNTLSIQTAQRLKEAGDINTLKALYDLPN
ncbi:MAG TPA: TerB family tellurite resistance protein [Puia sp.]|jgi:hypothetical protein|nr:TerB family tellurite resistance protein [Puia sp.]